MQPPGWVEALKPRSTGTKVLAVLVGLGVLNLGVAVVRGAWSWGDFGLLAAVAGIYALILAGSAQKISQTQGLVITLAGTWVGVALVLLLSIWMVLRATNEPDGDSGLVTAISIIMGWCALLAVVLAVLHSRKLLRLLRVAREQNDTGDA
jgi:hypothetical protein